MAAKIRAVTLQAASEEENQGEKRRQAGANGIAYSKPDPGRPKLIKGKSQRLFAGMGRLQENTVLNVKNKSFSVTAEVEVPDVAEGVILGQGGRFGGWSLYTKAGKAKFVYNLFGIQRWHIEAGRPIPKGKHEIRMEFAYGAVAGAVSGHGGKQPEGSALGQGGTVSLYYDGEKVGQGRVDRTVPFCFSADETADVGRATATSPTDDYDIKHSVFNGRIDVVRIDLGDEDFHVAPEERLRIAMANRRSKSSGKSRLVAESDGDCD